MNRRTAPPEELLRRVDGWDLADRVILCHQTEVRLEEFIERDGLLLMDFAKYRWTRGPGRGSHDRPTRPIRMDDDETFVEQTAALYDPRSQHYIVEYNHHGVRSARIGEYLSNVDDVPDNNYKLEPRFDPDAEQRLQNKPIRRKLQFRINTDLVPGRARNSAVGRSIGNFDNFGGRVLEVTVGMGHAARDAGLNDNMIQRTIDWLRSIRAEDDEAVSKIRVSAKDPDDVVEVIDLIEPKLSQEFGDLEMDEGRRYPTEERWNALLRAHRGWRRHM
ncbi:DUF6731 family protein [Gammaproteobacteria bacterium AB-CW1]|uniref:DUF6731 family protein n=1 Tax=Natronospira elongata TaxID=3110268 RepID=A0AAP6MLX2_9GAMM|nr:DUF6731 family protein [Gammaproteobacteria bacterium AB-CW1]